MIPEIVLKCTEGVIGSRVERGFEIIPNMWDSFRNDWGAILDSTTLARLVSEGLFLVRVVFGYGVLALIGGCVGFLYGRSFSREDSFRIISRMALYAGGVVFALSILGKGPLNPVSAIFGGFLLGFAMGSRVSRLRGPLYEKTEDTDHFTNAIYLGQDAKSPEEYLKSLSQSTRTVVKRMQVLQGILILTWAGSFALFMTVDCFGPLVRPLFVRPGDGTLYFITPENALGAMIWEMLTLSAISLAWDTLEGGLSKADLIACRVYAELKRHRAGHAEFSARTIRTAAGVLALPLLVVFALFFNTHVIVSDRGVAVNEFLQIHPRFYRWDQIRDVKTDMKPYVCKKGHTHYKSASGVHFSDGRMWIINDVPRRAALNRSAFQFVASHWRGPSTHFR